MSVDILERVETEKLHTPGEDLGHFVCLFCDPEGVVAFCGIVVDYMDFDASEEDVDCVVCLDIEWCPKCGSWSDSQ